MAVVEYAICTLAEAHTALEIPTATTDYDTQIETLIDAVTDSIEDYLGRRVVVRSTDITEYHTGDGSQSIYVQHPPINSLVSVAVEDETAIDIANTDICRYDTTSGEITLVTRTFTNAGLLNNVTITYEGGWASASVAPRAIWLACVNEVKRRYLAAHRNAEQEIASVSMEGQSVTYVQETGLSKDAKALLAPWIRRRYVG